MNIKMASILCGAGRFNQDDDVDPCAGILLKVKIGDVVDCGDLLAEIYTNKRNRKEISEKALFIYPHL